MIQFIIKLLMLSTVSGGLFMTGQKVVEKAITEKEIVIIEEEPIIEDIKHYEVKSMCKIDIDEYCTIEIPLNYFKKTIVNNNYLYKDTETFKMYTIKDITNDMQLNIEKSVFNSDKSACSVTYNDVTMYKIELDNKYIWYKQKGNTMFVAELSNNIANTEEDLIEQEFVMSKVFETLNIYYISSVFSKPTNIEEDNNSISNNEAEVENNIQANDNWKDMEFQYNNVVYKVPTQVSTFINNGFEVVEDTEKIEAYKNIRVTLIDKYGMTINAIAYNNNENEISINDAIVYYIVLDIDRFAMEQFSGGTDEYVYTKDNLPECYFVKGYTWNSDLMDFAKNISSQMYCSDTPEYKIFGVESEGKKLLFYTNNINKIYKVELSVDYTKL